MEFKELLKNYTNPPIDHKDYKKCGQCWRQVVQSKVAQSYLDNNISINTAGELAKFHRDVELKWRETPLYKEVHLLMKQGLSLQEIQEQFSKKGIEL